ncbi:MAG: flagellar hook-basal body complex protein [Novosphingobium sp.]
MFGSIYIGLSGLNAYSQGLKTVSNNVSNLNSAGFKASDISFSDIYGGGSAGGLNYGAGYRAQGHGVSFDDVTINFSQGELRQTGRDLDLAIDGGGFLTLIDGDRTYYARTGSFVIDEDGHVVLAGTDLRLAVLDSGGRPVGLNIDTARTSPPEQTTKIVFSDNLSSTATTHTISDLKLFDEGGGEHLWTIALTREETVPNQWTVQVTDGDGDEIGSQTLNFVGGLPDIANTTLTFEDSDSGLSVAFDFSGITSFSSGTVSTLRASQVDGHGTGTITTLTVNEQGQFEIAYSNEETRELGAIALADFRDPQKLQQRSNGLFAHSGFGQVQYLSAQDSRVGSILSGRLEASNVDLGAQFGDLILIQRGFQASSQIISVNNDMIQQLFGIRGQG